MKNLFMTLGAIALLTACSNPTEALRGSIEELGTKWDATTQQVTSLMESIGAEKGKLMGLMSKVNVTEQSGMTDEMQQRYAKAASALEVANQQLDGMKAEVESFVGNWSEKSSALDGLKEGLANGTLGKDAQTSIDELNGLISTGTESVTNWNTALEGVSNTVHQVMEAIENMDGQIVK
jgi:phage shock protein A